MKKLVGWLLCLTLVLGCAGAQAMTDGTYTGTGTGMKGPVTVEVNEETSLLTGPSVLVARGEIDVSALFV